MKKSSILAILGLSGFVVMADNWVVSPILPSIAAGGGVALPAPISIAIECRNETS
jgi:hypothetical protein